MALTWQRLKELVDSEIELQGLKPEEVEIDYIDIDASSDIDIYLNSDAMNMTVTNF